MTLFALGTPLKYFTADLVKVFLFARCIIIEINISIVYDGFVFEVSSNKRLVVVEKREEE